MPQVRELHLSEFRILSSENGTNVVAPELTEINAKTIELDFLKVGDLRRCFPKLRVLGKDRFSTIFIDQEMKAQLEELVRKGELTVIGTIRVKR
ncbi:MAG: hypothetical protein ACOCXQ_01115 [Patescibacteria group bacterium]